MLGRGPRPLGLWAVPRPCPRGRGCPGVPGLRREARGHRGSAGSPDGHGFSDLPPVTSSSPICDNQASPATASVPWGAEPPRWRTAAWLRCGLGGTPSWPLASPRSPWFTCSPARPCHGATPAAPAFLSFIPARSPRPTAAFQATALSHLWPVTPRGARLRDTPHTAPLTLGAEHGPSLLGLKRPSELHA